MTAWGDLTVIDASETVAGQYCGRLFAGYGADVTLIEPPGGSVIRRVGPFSQKFGDSTAFYHLNLDKRSRTLDLSAAADRAQFVELCSGADVVLVPASIEVEDLRMASPSTVFCRITDFGPTGPYANWRANEMVHQALSGVMYYNGITGREPLYGVGHRVQCVAGVAAYTAVLAALLAGQGDFIDIDVHKTAASMSYNLPNQYFYSGTFDERDGTKYNPDLLIRCCDGWVIVFIYAYRWEAFCEALGLDDLKRDPALATQAGRLANWDRIAEVASRAAGDISAPDLVQLLQSAGVPAAASLTPKNLIASPHLAERNYWREIPYPEGNRFAFGPPYRLSDVPWRADKPVTEAG